LFVIAAALLPLRDILLGGTGVPRSAIVVAYMRQITLLDPGISIFWTIRVEIIFYAVFVAIWFLHRRLAHRPATVSLLLAAVAALTACGFAHGGAFPGTARYFLFGVISALLFRPPPRARSLFVSALALLAFLAVPCSFPLVAKALTGADIDPWHSNVVAIYYIALFNLLLRDRGWLRSLLASPPARWLGRVSYSAYLLHSLVVSAVFAIVGHGARHAISLGAVLLGTLVIAGLSYSYVERPLQLLVLRLGSAAR
jgi:peptidoglycan/LPS O-acetylase OafA/YrhL